MGTHVKPILSRGNGRAGMKNPDLMATPRTTMPTAPCFHCGARGYCAHRAPDA